MKKLLCKLKIKSLKWQLLFSFLIILIILVGSMGIFEYISMKDYLCRTKLQVLQERFHNIDMTSLSKISMADISTSASKEMLKKLWDKNMSIALVDTDGNVLFQKTNADTPKDDNDGDDDSKELSERKIERIPVPILSKEHYRSICNKQGNLETTYEIIKDENSNFQLVAWKKVGNLDSPSGLIQLSTTIEDITGILHIQTYVHIGVSIIIIIIGTILGISIFKRTLKPLYNITDTVERINVTDLEKRLSEENGQLEIDRLAKSFNIMLARIF